ncbi:MAG: hypothetical protein PF541_15820 [Prolixibacteraceae bacterium]|jgi:drug/metabolite transporter (DMT)-like permease|nr:hypothetical protein [Prolixibacteraceae bacterium]
MIFLWLSILCSAFIYLSFKLRDKFKANLSGVIIINYFVASLLGIFTNPSSFEINKIVNAQWLPIAILIGLLFVIMFFLIGYSSHKAGIVVTTIATRMSMIVPIFFSLFLFNEIVTVSKIIKIAITLIAVILAIYHKPEKNIKKIIILLPLILFIGSGTVDTLVKTAQHLYIPENEIPIFSSSLFSISFLASLLLLFTKKPGNNLFNRNTFLLGISLGLFNFGSLFFFINALNKSGIDSSLLFGINNLCIVCISLLMGFFIFKEKLSRINWIGIFLSIFCIIILIQF